MIVLKKIAKKHFTSIPSTHTWASAHAGQLTPQMLMVTTAEEQSAGRGRYGHSWTCPPGQGLLASFSFLIESSRPDLANVPQILAISATRLFKKFNITAQIKWPNDLLIQKKKIGGILATTTSINGQLAMIVSIGLNLTVPEEFLSGLNRPATSLHLETEKDVRAPTICEMLTNLFLKDINTFILKGFHPFFEIYQERMAASRGESIRFHFNGTLLEGTFQEISPQGTLKLHLPGQGLVEFCSGELFINNA